MDGFDGLQMLGIGQPPTQNLGVAAHDHQQIIEVMGDAPRQLAERLHLLRLSKLLLGACKCHLSLAPLCNVAGNFGVTDQHARLVPDRFDEHICPE